MSILTHGSSLTLTLAPTIKPIIQQIASGGGGTIRAALDALTKSGFTAVQLDAALPGIRPRDLNIRGRRDLVALLSRQSMSLAGLDLFIPRRHFLDSTLVDRAMSATLSAIELAGDLGRVPLSIALPVSQLPDDARSALVAAADGHSVRLAVHAEAELDELQKWVNAQDIYALGVGLDPGALLSGKLDPSQQVHRFSSRLAVARLSDVTAPGAGGIRCEVGRGELDVPSYRVAVDLAPQRTGPVVLDLRGLPDPLAAAAAGKKIWDNAAFTA